MDSKDFQAMIRDVLNHLSDVAYLENHNLVSPLLTEEEARQPNHVQLLQNKISEGINALRPPENTPDDAAEWRCFRILSMRYLNNMDLYRVGIELGLSQRQVYRELKKGIKALISILWKQQEISRAPRNEKRDNQEEVPVSSDLHILEKELKNWGVDYVFTNLYQMIEQAYQLSEHFISNGLKEKVHLEQVDRNLTVRVDKTLTQQGLYKILTTAEEIMQFSEIWMQTRKLNEHFIELAIRIKHSQALNLKNWQIAQLFFTIQGFNHFLRERKNETLFTINLPLMHQNKVLVIDDMGPERALIERMLGPFGIQVFGTEHPQKALSLAQLLKPNFILLDILMPKMDGWKILKMLRNDPEICNTPIFICSVLNEPALAQSFGASGFIRKPINRLDLIDTLQKASLIDASQLI